MASTPALKSDSEGQPPRRRRSSTPATRYAKIGVTLPYDLARAAREQVVSGKAESLSALVTAALAEKLERQDLQQLLDALDAELGPVSAETQEWADQVVGRLLES